jgi:hypothetical protein
MENRPDDIWLTASGSLDLQHRTSIKPRKRAITEKSIDIPSTLVREKLQVVPETGVYYQPPKESPYSTPSKHEL